MPTLSYTFPFITLALITATTTLQAQTYAEFLRDRQERSFAEEQRALIPWSKSPLTWECFEGQPDLNDTLSYSLHFFSKPEVRTDTIGRALYSYHWPRTMLNPNTVWVKADLHNPTMLKFCQSNFNLVELVSRQAMIEYNNTIEYVIWDDMMDYYSQRLYRREDELADLTNRGQDAEMVDRYAAQLLEQLDTLHFDPTQFVQRVNFEGGFSFTVGAYGHIPVTEYASPSYGVDFTLGFYWRRSLFGFDMALGCGRCRKDIYEKHGVIRQDDYMLDGRMLLYYGREAVDRPNLRISPYVAMGVQFYDGGTKYDEYITNEESHLAEKAGFQFGLGAMFDVPFRTKYRIKTLLYNTQCDSYGLQFRPYFSCTKYKGDMGLVPAINIAISWSMFTKHN